MPYIAESERKYWDNLIESLKYNINIVDDMTPGFMNYIITKLCLAYLYRDRVSYSTINEIIGILECVKQEFYRKVASPYEEKKCKDNGEVY